MDDTLRRVLVVLIVLPPLMVVALYLAISHAVTAVEEFSLLLVSAALLYQVIARARNRRVKTPEEGGATARSGRPYGRYRWQITVPLAAIAAIFLANLLSIPASFGPFLVIIISVSLIPTVASLFFDVWHRNAKSENPEGGPTPRP